MLRRLFVALIIFAASLSASLHVPSAFARQASASRFGVNYLPQGYTGCDFLSAEGWPAAKAKVAQDLDLMRSLGATALRLPFWSPSSGFKAGWGVDTQMCKHLPDYLAMLKERDFKAIVMISNSYQRVRNGEPAWRIVYRRKHPGETEDELFSRYVRDSLVWHNAIVDLAESSPARDIVLFYDYTGEYWPKRPRETEYFRAIYEGSHIPRDKGGESLLFAPSGLTTGPDALLPQLSLLHGAMKFVDFHAYPAMPHNACPGNPEFKAAYEEVVAEAAAKLPGAQVVMGEFGRRALKGPQPVDDAPYPRFCPKDAGEAPARVFDEKNQAATVMDVINWAADRKVPIYAHWMLWDHSPRNDLPDSDPQAQVFGIGYTPDEPKDVLGAIATKFGIVKNGDMETRLGRAPANWRAQTAEIDATDVRLDASNDGAAANEYFARLETAAPCNACRVWLQSALAAVSPDRPVYVNAYIRGDMSQVRISLAQFDKDGRRLADIDGPTVAAAPDAWRSYLHRIPGGWRAELSPAARKIAVMIGGVPASAQSRLDIDAVSVSQ